MLHEFIQEFGTDICIGSLGALSKGTPDSGGDPVLHILHDGTRDTEVIYRIRVLDQDQQSTSRVESFRLVHPDRKRVSRSRVGQCKRRVVIRGYVYGILGNFCNAVPFSVFGFRSTLGNFSGTSSCSSGLFALSCVLFF